MKKLRLFIFLFLIAGSTISFGQVPFFMEQNDTIYFIVFYEESAQIEPAFPDLYYHTWGASTFFKNGEYIHIVKERDKEYWNILNQDSTTFMGFVVYYNGVELMREEKQVMLPIGIILGISGEYSKLISPEWLEGTWGGYIEIERDDSFVRLMIVDYNFDIEEGIFEVRYGTYPYQIPIIIDSVSSDYVRIKELHFVNDLNTIRNFGTEIVEFELLKKNETLHVQYPPADSNERMITGQLKKVLK